MSQSPAPLRPPSTGDEAGLRTELLALNEELRELKSTDHSARAYFLSWLALVAGSVSTKLVVDWVRTEGKPPVFGIPVLALGVWALVKATGHRRKARRLGKHEAVRMTRQLELRRLLGLEEAVFPETPALTREVA